MANEIPKKTVIKALQSPHKLLVDYLLTYVNLSNAELSCINYCICLCLTEEKTAEKLQVSRDFVAKHKRYALKKCQKAFISCPLLVDLLANSN